MGHASPSREHLSHELRTPLTVIKTSLQYVLKRWEKLPDRERREYLLQTLLEVDLLEGAIRHTEAAMEDSEAAAVIVLEEPAEV